PSGPRGRYTLNARNASGARKLGIVATLFSGSNPPDCTISPSDCRRGQWGGVQMSNLLTPALHLCELLRNSCESEFGPHGPQAFVAVLVALTGHRPSPIASRLIGNGIDHEWIAL